MSKEQNNRLVKRIFDNYLTLDLAMLANFMDSFGWYCKKYYFNEDVSVNKEIKTDSNFYDLMKIFKENSNYIKLFLSLSDEYVE